LNGKALDSYKFIYTIQNHLESKRHLISGIYPVHLPRGQITRSLKNGSFQRLAPSGVVARLLNPGEPCGTRRLSAATKSSTSLEQSVSYISDLRITPYSASQKNDSKAPQSGVDEKRANTSKETRDPFDLIAKAAILNLAEPGS
jgi:hypothetical protein